MQIPNVIEVNNVLLGLYKISSVKTRILYTSMSSKRYGLLLSHGIHPDALCFRSLMFVHTIIIEDDPVSNIYPVTQVCL
jgi:hypothetical protein